MASRKVEVQIVGDARSLQSAFNKAGRAANQFGKQSKLGSVGMGILAGATAGATVAIGRGLVNAMRSGVSEFQAQAKVSAQTAAAIKSTGAAAGVTQKHIEEMSSALQDQTGLADDAVQGAQNLLLTFTKISNAGPDKIFDRATRASADLSVALGRDLNGSAMMVGKALNDPIKGVTALGRAGVQFTAAQKETIKSLVETGRVADAQKMILKELETQVGGSAKAFGDSTPGQLAKAQRAYEDLTESVASALVPALGTLLPLVTRAMGAIAPIVQKAAKAFADLVIQVANSDQFKQLATAVKDLATQGIAILSAALKVLVPLVIAIVAPLAAFAAGVLNSKTALIALAAAASAFVAVRLARSIQETASSLRSLAITSGTVGVMNQLGNALSLATMGFKGVSAQAVGLAPGLTAAQAGMGRMATAGKIAGGAMKSFGSAAVAAAGGPWVLAIAAGTAVVTTLATVIGGDMVRSFMGAKGAVDQLRDAMSQATTASQNLQSAQAGMQSGLLQFAQASDTEAAARQRANQASRDAASAAATYGAGSAQARAAAQAERDAQAALSAAIASTDSSRSNASAGIQSYIGRLRENQGAVQGVSQKLAGAVAPLGLVNTKTKEGAAAWARYQGAQRLANQEVGNSAPYRTQQAELRRLADFLGGLGPKYAGVAREADKVAKMKPGAAQEKALEGLVSKLQALDSKVKGTQPTLKLKGVDTAEQAIARVQRKLDNIRDKTVTVTVNEVTNASGGGAGAMTGGRKGEKELVRLRNLTQVTQLPQALQQVFLSIRSSVTGAVSSLSSMFTQARRAIYSAATTIGNQSFGASLNANQKTLSDRQSQRQEKALIANRDRLNADAASTAEERQAAQDELDDFYLQKEIARQQEAVDSAVTGDERALQSLTNRFQKGEISAAQFQGELDKLIGGETGKTLGEMFGTEWIDAVAAALAPLRDEILKALGLDNIVGAEGSPVAAAQRQDNAAWREWRTKRGNFIRALNNAKKDGYTADEKKAMRQRWGADDLAEWEKENAEPPRYLATGGIVTGPTNAVIGEAGREAVIPLEGPRARRMLRGANGIGSGQVTMVFNGVLNAKDAARMLRPELDRLVRLAA